MREKAPRYMGLLAICLSGLFLFDPIIGFADLLPDVFGYLFLWVGLRFLADLNGEAEEALRRVRVLFWVGVGQLIAMLTLYIDMPRRATEMNQYEQPVAILLCAFVLLVLQWYFLIPAFKHLFAGTDQLAEREDARALLTEKRGRTRGERLARFSVFFVVFHSLMTLLPELSILTSFEHDVNNVNFHFDWYDFILLFRTLGVFLSLIVSVVWLIAFLRYFAAFLREKDTVSAWRTRYESEILTQTNMLRIRRFQLALLLLSIGSVFTVSLRLGGQTALPGAVFGILCFLSAALCGDRTQNEHRVKLCSVATVLVSVAHTAVNRWYLYHHLPEASLYEHDAYVRFLAVRIFNAAEVAVTFLLTALLLRWLIELAHTYTSVDYGGENAAVISDRATARLHQNFEKRAKIIFVFFALAAVCQVFDAFLLLQFPWIWIVAFVFSFVAIWNLFSMLHELQVQIRCKLSANNAYKKQ